MWEGKSRNTGIKEMRPMDPLTAESAISQIDEGYVVAEDLGEDEGR